MQPAHRKCKWDKRSENKLEMKPKGRYNNGRTEHNYGTCICGIPCSDCTAVSPQIASFSGVFVVAFVMSLAVFLGKVLMCNNNATPGGIYTMENIIIIAEVH